jgi:hypothetical protein
MDTYQFSKREIADYVSQMLAELAKMSRPLKSDELEQSLHLSRLLARRDRQTAKRHR